MDYNFEHFLHYFWDKLVQGLWNYESISPPFATLIEVINWDWNVQSRYRVC